MPSLSAHSASSGAMPVRASNCSGVARRLMRYSTVTGSGITPVSSSAAPISSSDPSTVQPAFDAWTKSVP